MDQGERIYVPDKDICMQACSSSTTLVLDEEILFKVIAHPLPNLTLCGGGGGGGGYATDNKVISNRQTATETK